MSNFYYDQPSIATIPRCTKIAFLRWCETFRRFRRAQALAMLDGTTVYYFSTSGSDANDGLTDATPKKTIGAAQTILAAWSNSADGLVLKFKCGDTWNPDTVGEGKLDFSSKTNVCFTNYGDKSLGLPFFSRWKTPVRLDAFEDSTDRADAFTNTYSVAKPGAESWYTIRPFGRKDVHFRHVSSIAEVDALPGSCWIDHAGDGRMYFRPLTTRSQLFDYYEGLTPDPTYTDAMIGNDNTVLAALGTGAKIAVIGVEISGVAIAEFGGETVPATAGNPIHLRGYNDATLYVLDSCVTYASRHLIVTASGQHPSITGTIQFIDNCSLGWQSSSTGATLTVANSLGGGTEMFISNCTVLGGDIRRPTVSSGGTAFFSHGLPSTLLDVVYNCHAPATPGQVSVFAGFGNMSTAATIDDCRHFVVNCSIKGRQPYLNEVYSDDVSRWTAANVGEAQWVINSKMSTTMISSRLNLSNTVMSANQIGNFVNCEWKVDCGRSRSRPASDVDCYVSTASQVQFNLFSCALIVENLLSGQFAWVSQQRAPGTVPSAQYKANRCLFVNRSASVRKTTLQHNAAYYGFNVEECGYAGISRYWQNSLVAAIDYVANDPTGVVMQEMAEAGGVPDELALDGPSYVVWNGVEYELEYDALGRPRSGRNAIGPMSQDIPTGFTVYDARYVHRHDAIAGVY
jgi:hypothetical protein